MRANGALLPFSDSKQLEDKRNEFESASSDEEPLRSVDVFSELSSDGQLLEGEFDDSSSQNGIKNEDDNEELKSNNSKLDLKNVRAESDGDVDLRASLEEETGTTKPVFAGAAAESVVSFTASTKSEMKNSKSLGASSKLTAKNKSQLNTKGKTITSGHFDSVSGSASSVLGKDSIAARALEFVSGKLMSKKVKSQLSAGQQQLEMKRVTTESKFKEYAYSGSMRRNEKMAGVFLYGLDTGYGHVRGLIQNQIPVLDSWISDLEMLSSGSFKGEEAEKAKARIHSYRRAFLAQGYKLKSELTLEEVKEMKKEVISSYNLFGKVTNS